MSTFFPKSMTPDGPGHRFRLGTVSQKDQTLIIILNFYSLLPQTSGVA